MTKHPRQVNPIDVVEAAYDLEVTDREWLTNLATTIRPLLDGGRGLAAYQFDAHTPPSEWFGGAVLLDMDAAHVSAGIELANGAPEITTFVYFHNEGLLALVDLGRRAGLGDLRKRAAIRRYFAFAGVQDFAALQTVEPGGRGVVFAAGQSECRSFDARTRHLWARVNAHIAAGRRLRRAAAEATAPIEAVLTPSGRLEHAEDACKSASARDALRAAVFRQEKARGAERRRDPAAATEGWTALVSGRWSLVDRFERGGRRYIVARRNEHAVSDPRALTPRERAIAHLAALGKPNRLIGYELGLAESTVGSHLSTIMRKLGVRSRVELLELVSRLRT